MSRLRGGSNLWTSKKVLDVQKKFLDVQKKYRRPKKIGRHFFWTSIKFFGRLNCTLESIGFEHPKLRPKQNIRKIMSQICFSLSRELFWISKIFLTSKINFLDVQKICWTSKTFFFGRPKKFFGRPKNFWTSKKMSDVQKVLDFQKKN